MEEETKVRENRLRRVAERRGYRLEKSRRRDSQAVGYNGFMLVGMDDHQIVLGELPFAYSATLDDIEKFFVGEIHEPQYIQDARDCVTKLKSIIIALETGMFGVIDEKLVKQVLYAQHAIINILIMNGIVVDNYKK